MRLRQRAFRPFAISCGFVLFCVAVLSMGWNDDATRAHVEVSGTLKEYEVFGRRKSPTLRFKLAESELDFRVDPSLFRYAMGRAAPAEFKAGAATSVSVMKGELAQPRRPLLNSDLHIAWVHGLKIDGREVFGLREVREWEREDRYWGYALLVCSLASAIYFGFKWQRGVGPTSRSTRGAGVR